MAAEDPPVRASLPRQWARLGPALSWAADAVERVRAAFMRRLRRIHPLRRRAVLHGVVLGGYVGFFILISRGIDFFAYDACAYWAVDLANPYGGAYGSCGYFNYSPAAALLAQPFKLLPWTVYAIGWSALLLVTLFWLGGRASLVLLAFPAISGEIYTGNIHLLLGAAMVLGFRYPAAWAFVLLTKVTPGVGLIWFVVRREWRSLAVALGATAAIVGVTWLFLPDQWSTWITLLRQNAGMAPEIDPLNAGIVPQLVPLYVRLPLAALIIAWGAAKDAPWTVPVGAVIATPVIWLISFAMLAACWPLRRGFERSPTTATTGTGAAPAVAA